MKLLKQNRKKGIDSSTISLLEDEVIDCDAIQGGENQPIFRVRTTEELMGGSGAPIQDVSRGVVLISSDSEDCDAQIPAKTSSPEQGLDQKPVVPFRIRSTQELVDDVRWNKPPLMDNQCCNSPKSDPSPPEDPQKSSCCNEFIDIVDEKPALPFRIRTTAELVAQSSDLSNRPSSAAQTLKPDVIQYAPGSVTSKRLSVEDLKEVQNILVSTATTSSASSAVDNDRQNKELTVQKPSSSVKPSPKTELPAVLPKSSSSETAQRIDGLIQSSGSKPIKHVRFKIPQSQNIQAEDINPSDPQTPAHSSNSILPLKRLSPTPPNPRKKKSKFARPSHSDTANSTPSALNRNNEGTSGAAGKTSSQPSKGKKKKQKDKSKKEEELNKQYYFVSIKLDKMNRSELEGIPISDALKQKKENLRRHQENILKKLTAERKRSEEAVANVSKAVRSRKSFGGSLNYPRHPSPEYWSEAEPNLPANVSSHAWGFGYESHPQSRIPMNEWRGTNGWPHPVQWRGANGWQNPVEWRGINGWQNPVPGPGASMNWNTEFPSFSPWGGMYGLPKTDPSAPLSDFQMCPEWSRIASQSSDVTPCGGTSSTLDSKKPSAAFSVPPAATSTPDVKIIGNTFKTTGESSVLDGGSLRNVGEAPLEVTSSTLDIKKPSAAFSVPPATISEPDVKTPLADTSSKPSASSAASVALPTPNVKTENSAPPKLPWTALSDTSWDALYR